MAESLNNPAVVSVSRELGFIPVVSREDGESNTGRTDVGEESLRREVDDDVSPSSSLAVATELFDGV